MLSERLLSAVVRRANRSILRLEPFEQPKLPGPAAGKRYMLYAHVPFCERLCPYCSFNRYPFAEDAARAYFRSLREEMRAVADLGYRFRSLYVGGGTPTVLVDELCAAIDLARDLFGIEEVSTETNPNHLDEEHIAPLAERVHRFSVGVQSFDDDLLRQMDRYEKYGSGERILESLQAVAHRFHSVNVDMIFNFPSQTPEVLRADIEAVKASGCNQTTFYPLMASPVVSRSLAETVGRVDYAREAGYYATIAEGLADTHEPASAWTFSRIEGGMIDEYILDYEDYVGVGSGAFSYLDGALYVNTFSLAEYGEALSAGRMSATRCRRFSKAERMRYRFMMELFGGRLDKETFRRDFGVGVAQGLPVETAFMRWNRAYATDDASQVTLTPRGRYLLVAMMREFFIGVNDVRDQARASLSGDEREVLFGDGECAGGSSAPPPRAG